MILLMLAGACVTAEATSPRCNVAEGVLTCDHETTILFDGVEDREVHWQIPAGDAPADGWPVALGFQGSFASAELNWEASVDTPAGGLYQAEATDQLLSAGFAVITPEAPGGGLAAWNTNVPPFAGEWEGAPDDVLMQLIFGGIENGDFGPLDGSSTVAFGISSGGYMTSRMALSYPGRMHRLVILSASWATCVGIACVLPESLPADHPPTLFLHGGSDKIVPAFTMQGYADRLIADGVEVETFVPVFIGHEWFAEAPGMLVEWVR